MDKKNLLKEIGRKLQDIRKARKYSITEMANQLDAYRTSYYRYEEGQRSPQIMPLYNLGKKFDISLDWLIFGKGPMIAREKEAGKTVTKEPQPVETRGTQQSVQDDIKILLDHMERIPLLRYEVLVLFHTFLDEHKDMVADAMT